MSVSEFASGLLNKRAFARISQPQTGRKYSQCIYLTEDSHPEYIKTFYKLTIKRQLSKKRAKDLNKNFTKEDLGMANKPIKRSSTSLVIRNMQFKGTMEYHFIPIRMAKIQKSDESQRW